jgi:hypothetical protein
MTSARCQFGFFFGVLGMCCRSCQAPGKRLGFFIVSVLESIVKDLETLPAPKLVEVARYVSRLNPRRREERLNALRATAGCLSGEKGAAFENAVREEGSRVDSDDWNSVLLTAA